MAWMGEGVEGAMCWGMCLRVRGVSGLFSLARRSSRYVDEGMGDRKEQQPGRDFCQSDREDNQTVVLHGKGLFDRRRLAAQLRPEWILAALAACGGCRPLC